MRGARAGRFASAYADAGDDRIHIVEAGMGEALLLLHGAFGSGVDILERDFGRGLAERFRVIAPDSLGHGESSAPDAPERYGAERRAAQTAAVLDALGIDRAHVVGYSMGGWMASAFATHHPDRIASLAIGGWDVVAGMYTPAAAWGLEEITGRYLIELAREVNPEIAEWVGPQEEAPLALAIEGMNDLSGLAEGVARLNVPVAIWMGRDDLYYDAARAFAEAHEFPFIELPGDHMVAFEEHGGQAAALVAEFIATAAREANAT